MLKGRMDLQILKISHYIYKTKFWHHEVMDIGNSGYSVGK